MVPQNPAVPPESQLPMPPAPSNTTSPPPANPRKISIPPSPWAFLDPFLPPHFQTSEADSGVDSEIFFTLARERYHITYSSLEHLCDYLAQRPHLTLNDFSDYASTHTHITMAIQCLESEANATPGRGFCSVLALAGLVDPKLNTWAALPIGPTRVSLVSFLQDYLYPTLTSPQSFPDTGYSDIQADAIIALTTIIKILESPSTEDVPRLQWMDYGEAACILERLPTGTMWTAIGSNWMTLTTWSQTLLP